jgi:hypothetical protein
MTAAVNKATKANRVARISKVARVAKVVRQAQGAVIQETRDNRAEQIVVVVSKVNRAERQIVIANKDSKGICPTVIANKDKKGICPTVIASKASKKKLLQIVMLHLTTKIRTVSSQNREVLRKVRILTAEWVIKGICLIKVRARSSTAGSFF